MSSATEAAPVDTGHREILPSEERLVIFASSLGTVFEWYDFYLYAILAPFFAALFFPPGNETAALLRRLRAPTPPASSSARSARWSSAASATWSAANTPSSSPSRSWASATVAGRLPAHATRRSASRRRSSSSRCASPRASRWAASTAAPRPTSPSTRRTTSAATRPAGSRPRPRSACFLALIIIGICRATHGSRRPSPAGAGASRSWSPSSLLAFSVYIRLKLNESPVFQRMKAEGKRSKAAAARQLPQVPEQQVRRCSRCSAPPPARAWSGTPASSTRCSS